MFVSHWVGRGRDPHWLEVRPYTAGWVDDISKIGELRDEVEWYEEGSEEVACRGGVEVLAYKPQLARRLA